MNQPPVHSCWALAAFIVNGAMNADVADVIANPAYLVGPAPLVLLDRDGSIAMAVGGILSQKSPRPIKVLYGGLEAYWRDSSAPAPVPAASAPALAPAPIRAPAPSTPAPAKPAAPKKKSAGC